MVKTIELIGVLDYPDNIEEAMSAEEYIEKVTEKGYKVAVVREPRLGTRITEIKIYKEIEYKGAKQNDSKEM